MGEDLMGGSTDREALLEIAIAVNSAPSLDEILRVVIERVAEIIPHDRSGIALLDEESGLIEFQVLETSVALRPSEVVQRVPLDESTVLGWVMLHREVHLRRALDEHYPFKRLQLGEEVPSHIFAPLLGRDEALGVLLIGSYDENAFTDADAALFSRYAKLTAIAIENLRHYLGARDHAIRDPLTRSYNRRYFREVLNRELARIERYGGSSSLLMVDIDHFKALNDQFGHLAGDRVLRNAVALFSSHLRESDLIFRYGGEEFALLLPATDAEAALRVAEKLRECLRENKILQASQNEAVTITASIGVASAPVDAQTFEGLVACADQALYKAKAIGRDRVVSFARVDEVYRAADQLGLSQDVARQLAILFGPEREERRRHSERVMELAGLLAERLELPGDQRLNLGIAAAYHDIGELGVPAEILDKPGSLAEDERRAVETHPVVGESILRRSVKVREILQAVLYHHERYDGTGYPEGLRSDQIPILARVLAIAETFDALVTPRPYRREPLTREAAYEVLREVAGFQLDPDLVEEFIASHSAGEGPEVIE